MTDTVLLPTIKIKRTTRTRKPQPRAVAPEAAPVTVEPPHTQSLWTYRRNMALAMGNGEIDSTFLYFSETAPAGWLDEVTA